MYTERKCDHVSLVYTKGCSICNVHCTISRKHLDKTAKWTKHPFKVFCIFHGLCAIGNFFLHLRIISKDILSDPYTSKTSLIVCIINWPNFERTSIFLISSIFLICYSTIITKVLDRAIKVYYHHEIRQSVIALCNNTYYMLISNIHRT